MRKQRSTENYVASLTPSTNNIQTCILQFKCNQRNSPVEVYTISSTPASSKTHFVLFYICYKVTVLLISITFCPPWPHYSSALPIRTWTSVLSPYNLWTLPSKHASFKTKNWRVYASASTLVNMRSVPMPRHLASACLFPVPALSLHSPMPVH